MFDNSVTLYAKPILTAGVLTGVDGVTVSLVDTQSGKSIRQDILGDVETTLTTARSGSNENPGFVTDRRVVRIDTIKNSSIAGKRVTASAYLVLSAPRAEFEPRDLGLMVYALAKFLLPTCLNASGDSEMIADVSDSSEPFPRFLNGEL